MILLEQLFLIFLVRYYENSDATLLRVLSDTGLSEQGWAPDFDRSATLTRGADYAHPNTTCPPPGFSDLPKALG